MTKFTIKTALLEALNRFAADWDSTRGHLATVYVGKTELVATNGHRIVIVPNIPLDGGVPEDARCVGDIDEPFLIPSQLILHHVAAVRSTWEDIVETESPFTGSLVLAPNSFSRATTEVTTDGDRVRLEHDGITVSCKCEWKADTYPKHDHIGPLTSKGAPKPSRFDPKLFDGLRDIMRAANDYGGMTLHAWDGSGTGCGPTEYRSAQGTRFVLMGMAENGKEARQAQERMKGMMRGDQPVNER